MTLQSARQLTAARLRFADPAQIEARDVLGLAGQLRALCAALGARPLHKSPSRMNKRQLAAEIAKLKLTGRRKNRPFYMRQPR